MADASARTLVERVQAQSALAAAYYERLQRTAPGSDEHIWLCAELEAQAQAIEGSIQQIRGIVGDGDDKLGAMVRRAQQYVDFLRPALTVDAGPAEHPSTPPPGLGDLLAERERLLGEQDRGLDELAGAVGRLHRVAGAITTEVDTHNVLLDEVDVDVERARARIVAQSKSVDRLRRERTRIPNICAGVLVVGFLATLLAIIIWR